MEGTAGQVLRGLSVDLSCVRKTITFAARREKGVDLAGSRRRAIGDVTPRCAICQASLHSTLAHKAVLSRGEDGRSIQWLLAYCSSCGTTLGGNQI